MGYAATRTLDRVSAALGVMGAASIEFASAQDIPQGGLLLAVLALLAMGLLRQSLAMYALPRGYYGLSGILLLLAMMALRRVKSIEQSRYVAPGEWGNLLGLDRIPEVLAWGLHKPVQRRSAVREMTLFDRDVRTIETHLQAAESRNRGVSPTAWNWCLSPQAS